MTRICFLVIAIIATYVCFPFAIIDPSQLFLWNFLLEQSGNLLGIRVTPNVKIIINIFDNSETLKLKKLILDI